MKKPHDALTTALRKKKVPSLAEPTLRPDRVLELTTKIVPDRAYFGHGLLPRKRVSLSRVYFVEGGEG